MAYNSGVRCSEDIWNKFKWILHDLKKPITKMQFFSMAEKFIIDELHTLREVTVNEMKLQERSINELFSCGNCIDIMDEPVTLRCGHTFCRECLKKRESQCYKELCFKCDEYQSKRIKLFFSRNMLDSLKNNVILSSIIKECFSEELKAKKLRLQGNECFNKKRLDIAKEKYMSAISCNATNFHSWSNLSGVHAVSDKFEEALLHAQKAMEICPSWHKGYYREGIAFKGLERYSEATVSFLKSLIVDPTSATVQKLFFESMQKHFDSFLNANERKDLHDVVTDSKVFDELWNDNLKTMVDAGLEFSLDKKLVVQHQRPSEFIKKVVEKMGDEFTCPLCCRILYQPYTTVCGHTFCTTCLERSLDYNNICSICRHPLNDIIAMRPKPICQGIQSLLRSYFPKELEDREEIQHKEKRVIYVEGDAVTVPIFVCMYAFPTQPCSLHIFEPRYKLLLRRCLESESKMFGMCMYNSQNGFVDYGTMLEIIHHLTLDDGRILVKSRGGRRFKVLERGQKDGYYTAKISWISDSEIPDEKRNVLEELNNDVYKQCMTWLTTLPRLTYLNIYQNFGAPPSIENNELIAEHGPKWIWWMMQLILQDQPDELIEILKSTTVESRLVYIKNRICSFQEISV